jgi:hypothetical protein
MKVGRAAMSPSIPPHSGAVAGREPSLRAPGRRSVQPESETKPSRTEDEGPEVISMLRAHTLAMATGLAVAVSALAPTSRAQAPPGMMGMMGGGANTSPIMILLAPSVQKELKLSEDQKAKAYSLARTQGQKSRDLTQTMMVAGGNPQASMMAMMRLRQESDQAIGKILDAKQKERLNQIVLQAEGPLAVARPEIARPLRLNETQSEYVQTVMMQMRREMVVAMRQSAAAGQFNPAQMRVVASRLRQSAVQEVSKVIDRKQKVAFNKMLGEPFDLNKLDSETAGIDPAIPPPADSTKPTETAQTKDTPAADQAKAAETEKEPAKETAKPARKKGRS